MVPVRVYTGTPTNEMVSDMKATVVRDKCIAVAKVVNGVNVLFRVGQITRLSYKVGPEFGPDFFFVFGKGCTIYTKVGRTWIQESVHEPTLASYNFTHDNRIVTKLYEPESICVVMATELDITEENYERRCVWSRMSIQIGEWPNMGRTLYGENVRRGVPPVPIDTGLLGLYNTAIGLVVPS